MDKFKQFGFYQHYMHETIYICVDGVLVNVIDVDDCVIPSHRSINDWIRVEVTNIEWKVAGS